MKEIGDSVKHVDQLIEDFELFEEKGKVSGLASKSFSDFESHDFLHKHTYKIFAIFFSIFSDGADLYAVQQINV